MGRRRLDEHTRQRLRLGPSGRPAPLPAVGAAGAAQADHLVRADVGVRLRHGLVRRPGRGAPGPPSPPASLLAGPLVCGTSQAVNDWFDRHVDAINEPDRPIPSGRVPGQWGLAHRHRLDLLSLAMACMLGPWVSVAAALGLALAWAYSAPPVRLKRNGWWGNLAVGVCYEGLPWFAGAAVLQAAMPDSRIIAARPALQHRRARHHDPERFQVDRGRQADGHRIPAGAARRRPPPAASPAW